METSEFDADEVQQICRSCLCKGDKLIPLDVPYNDVVNTKYEYVDECETIAKLMMACGNIQIEPDDGLPQSVCIKCFMNIRATFVYRQMCEHSDAELRKIFQQQLPTASVKFEQISGEVDPLEETYFYETSSEQDGIFSDIDVKSDKLLEPLEYSEMSVDFGTIPRHKNISKAAKSRGRPTKWKINKISVKSKANMKTKLTMAASLDQNVKKISIDEIENAMDQTKNTPNSTPKEKVTNRQHICEVCAKVFKSSTTLKRHVYVHSDERNFQCDICKRRYKRKRDIQNHLRIHMEKTKFLKHLCSECGVGYKSVSQLATHMRRHTGERPFKCEKCERAFTCSTLLLRHQRIHDVVKPFNCSICGREFTRKDKYKLHMMMHNDIRPHKCDICDSGFTQPVLLRNHMETHKSGAHVCTVCDAKFSKSIQLINHRTMAGHVDNEE